MVYIMYYNNIRSVVSGVSETRDRARTPNGLMVRSKMRRARVRLAIRKFQTANTSTYVLTYLYVSRIHRAYELYV